MIWDLKSSGVGKSDKEFVLTHSFLYRSLKLHLKLKAALLQRKQEDIVLHIARFMRHIARFMRENSSTYMMDAKNNS